MPLEQRDYFRSRGSSSPFARMRWWSITNWLIAINVAVYLVDVVSQRHLFEWGYFSAETAIYHLQLWRFITFQFLHASVTHILFNMIALYFFGPMIERYLGSRRYLGFYLLCGISGAVMYLLLMYARVPGFVAWVPLIGASAGILGILIAAARIAPNAQVMLLIPPIPMRLRTLAWIFIGIAVVTIISQGSNAGGEGAHLGGAATGFLLIQRPQLLRIFDFNWWRRPPRGPRMSNWR